LPVSRRQRIPCLLIENIFDGEVVEGHTKVPVKPIPPPKPALNSSWSADFFNAVMNIHGTVFRLGMVNADLLLVEKSEVRNFAL
jgi:hypothetical protein